MDFDRRPIDSLTITGEHAFDKAYIVSHPCAGQSGAKLASWMGGDTGA
ncbi:MAG TPA: hypothetical protein VFN79_11950 [Steroidobacteraceae bacterium]|nr:hypothetical protein [Steroidobacteraceae bacterium]